jgi:hypothetical protein
MKCRKWQALSGAVALALWCGVGSAWAAESAATPDVDAQYETVLAEMKHPPATGILVTEVGAESAAGAAGLQAGDIIFHYAGSDVHELQALRQAVADTFASHVAGDAANNVLLGVHRSGQNVLLQVPRQPLGIRAVEVEAGVPVQGNPAPSPRGTITLAWDDVVKQQITTAEGDSAFFRLNEVGGKPGETLWTGWQRRAMTVAHEAIVGELDQYHTDPEEGTGAIVASEIVKFRLRVGDYVSEPAFVLESMDVTLNNGDGSRREITGKRAGVLFRAENTLTTLQRIVGPAKISNPAPIGAIPSAAIPLVAAAMPQEKGAALTVSLLSYRDGVSRPGYVLVARGQQALRPEKDAPLAWRVELIHCGVIVDTYWFNDQRRLLQVDSPSGTITIARRVGSLADASVPAVPATAPATQPGH